MQLSFLIRSLNIIDLGLIYTGPFYKTIFMTLLTDNISHFQSLSSHNITRIISIIEHMVSCTLVSTVFSFIFSTDKTDIFRQNVDETLLIIIDI